MTFYCGDKPTPPGRRKGTALQCFKKGIKTGIAVSYRTIIPKALKQRTRQVEAITKGETTKRIARSLQTEGLPSLKRHLHLTELNKDELRSIAVRLHHGPQQIPAYYNMSKQALTDALVQRGFQL